MIQILTIIILIFVFSGCCSTNDEDFEFDNNEPQHMSSYNIDDTIYFENSKNDVDTITVLSIDSAEGERCYGLIAPKPTGKSRWITINAKTNDTISVDYTKLIEIRKDPIDNTTYFDFSFKDFYTTSETVLGKLNTDTLNLNEKKITNYYVIHHGFPDRVKDSTSIETLIWTNKDGLTAYKNKAGNWWTKK